MAETRQLVICRGIQGSGKSTWAKQWCHEDPEHRVRFNNDDVRNMLGDYWVPNREKVVTATYNTVLAYSMQKGYNIVAVVTAPDKPAGRGYNMQESAVKTFAKSANLPVLQPVNMKDEGFLAELKSYNADIQIVIAFRMMPEKVWNMPPMGTFNLHASYLPNYRGAAPINWAIINGEKETGVTTFFLKHEIDTGSIILQEKTNILPSDNAGKLHDKLMMQGAELVVKSLDLISNGKTWRKAKSIFPLFLQLFSHIFFISLEIFTTSLLFK